MTKESPPLDDPTGSPTAKMRTIAERLNLSVATVSRALRRVPGINPETRARVVQAASLMGYHLPKNYRTEPLDGGTLRHIGALVEMPANGMPPDSYIVGMSDAATTFNASLIVHYVKPENCEQILKAQFQPRAMSAGLLSGIVLVFRWPTHVVEKLCKMLPTVSITHQYAGVDTDVLGIDHHGGVALLMQLLHGLGHRRIGFFGRCPDLYWSSVRFGGYVASLTTHRLEYRPEWVVDVDQERLISMQADWNAYCAQAERVTRDGVTAWICASEPAGWELTTCLRARGFRVPEDVSVTGFHAPDGPDAAKPFLTSVRASYEAIGAAAMKRVLYRIQNPAESTRTILFPSEMRKGVTVGPPPGLPSGSGLSEEGVR